MPTTVELMKATALDQIKADLKAAVQVIADTAEISKTAAAASATQAENIRVATGGIRDAAEASKTAAAASATNASTSATNAQNSANTALTYKNAAASSAALAAASAPNEFGVYVIRDAGVISGGYPATRSTWKAVNATRVFVESIGGSSVVTVLVNGVAAVGPFTVSNTLTQAISVAIPQGAAVAFDISTASATKLWAQIDGVAA